MGLCLQLSSTHAEGETGTLSHIVATAGKAYKNREKNAFFGLPARSNVRFGRQNISSSNVRNIPFAIRIDFALNGA
jgi:hypothetical protein